MAWFNNKADIFVPLGGSEKEALTRTTHLAIGAHPDDLEIMCWHGILACFRRSDHWFTGITVTDGAGSPRSEAYANLSDREMVEVRHREQRAAALSGEYSAQLSLMYSSKETRETQREKLIQDLEKALRLAQPEVLYTHNLFDKHPTHIAVATAVIEAARRSEISPQSFFGCEVWRGLDWLPDEQKITLDVSRHQGLTRSLVGLYDSQISGGKRYDLATVGRKRANATYFDAYQADQMSHSEYAVDMLPLLENHALSLEEYVKPFLERFLDDVVSGVGRY